MYLLTFIFVLGIGYLGTQIEAQGTCTVWGDPHLVGFPVDPAQANLRSGYWCQWKGRMLILKNDFIEFYVDVTDSPYWNENYEISLLSGNTKLCTITPSQNNCPSNLVDVLQPRNAPNSRQIYYDAADSMEISIFSYSVAGRLVYNIEVTQSYSLILSSTGLCVTRLRQCVIESSGRRKRSASEATATQVCDIFMAEGIKAATQLVGNAGSRMTAHAREGCISDVILTNDAAWGQSAVGFVVLDSIRQAGLTRIQRKELMVQVFSIIEEAAGRAKQKASSLISHPNNEILILH